MEPIIARCGYRCDLCPAYKTNLKSDADKIKMCDAWTKYFGSEVPPEAITACDGCLEEGGDPNCDVRPCATEKSLDNCAHCEHFACDKLKPKMNFVEENVKDLSNIPKEDYNSFIRPFLGKDYLNDIRESLKS